MRLQISNSILATASADPRGSSSTRHWMSTWSSGQSSALKRVERGSRKRWATFSTRNRELPTAAREGSAISTPMNVALYRRRPEDVGALFAAFRVGRCATVFGLVFAHPAARPAEPGKSAGVISGKRLALAIRTEKPQLGVLRQVRTQAHANGLGLRRRDQHHGSHGAIAHRLPVQTRQQIALPRLRHVAVDADPQRRATFSRRRRYRRRRQVDAQGGACHVAQAHRHGPWPLRFVVWQGGTSDTVRAGSEGRRCDPRSEDQLANQTAADGSPCRRMTGRGFVHDALQRKGATIPYAPSDCGSTHQLPRPQSSRLGVDSLALPPYAPPQPSKAGKESG